MASARWALRDKHYLNIMTPEGGHDGEWEYKEQARGTQKTVRLRFNVPTLLDPTDPSSHNDKVEGRIIVTNKFDRAHPNDLIFVGKPTRDMEPLNDEAQALSDAEAPNWKHPIETLPGDMGSSLLRLFETQLAEATRKSGSVPTVTPVGATTAELDALRDQINKVLEANAQLQAQLLEARAAKPDTTRRSVA